MDIVPAGMLQKMGGRATSIEGEAAYRPQWKQELYPVLFGDPKAPHEVLVLLDFASPQSEKVWHDVGLFDNDDLGSGVEAGGLGRHKAARVAAADDQQVGVNLDGFNIVKAGRPKIDRMAAA